MSGQICSMSETVKLRIVQRPGYLVYYKSFEWVDCFLFVELNEDFTSATKSAYFLDDVHCLVL